MKEIKKSKFRTDLHTHMNANLSPDCLIALGIIHQVRYPLYYIKKLKLLRQKGHDPKIKRLQCWAWPRKSTKN